MSERASRRQFITGAVASAAGLLSNPAEAQWTMTPSMSAQLTPAASRWLIRHFGDTIREKIRGSPFSLALVCAIACQESGYVWFTRSMREGRTPKEVLRLLVLDNVSPRLRAFPRDTETFKRDPRFADISGDLIRASDASRVARGLRPTRKLLYGCGLFQYDLQYIETDPRFWRDEFDGKRGLWCDIGASTERLLTELNNKYIIHRGNLDETVRAYNGSGPNARAYSRIVRGFEREIARSGI
jgi:hypothetical protein